MKISDVMVERAMMAYIRTYWRARDGRDVRHMKSSPHELAAMRAAISQTLAALAEDEQAVKCLAREIYEPLARIRPTPHQIERCRTALQALTSDIVKEPDDGHPD